MVSRIFLIFIIWLPFVILSNAETLAVKGGKIYTMAGDTIVDGIILIENGRIKQVGTDLPIPSNAEILDATGKIILPGLFDAFSHVGLVEISAVPQSVDTEEKSAPLTPEVRVIDAFNTNSEIIPVTRIEGVTTVLVSPGGNNIIAGQSAVFDLFGEAVDEMLVKSPAALHINFGEGPTAAWRAQKKVDSRMGLVALLRQAFVGAQDYKRGIAEFENKMREFEDNKNLPENKRKKDMEEPSPPERKLGMEAIVMTLERKIPVIASAKRRDDILVAIKFAEEFNLNLILLHAAEAHMVAKILAQKGIPVLLGPITVQPSSMETKGAIYENAALLDKAGVKFAIITGGAHNVRDLRFQAGIAVEYGLSFESALHAMTINPAEILGLDTELGSIAPGKIANIAIFDGDPLQPMTKITDVVIEGKRVPMKSFQTDLYEKYK
jgi:imidazolonepropionase-like amidohydrolase